MKEQKKVQTLTCRKVMLLSIVKVRYEEQKILGSNKTSGKVILLTILKEQQVK